MDTVAWKKKLGGFWGKYKFALLILAAGLLLMGLPVGEQTTDSAPAPTQGSEEQSVQEQLEQILGQIQGVGKVSVFLTQRCGPETVYQTDEDTSISADSSSVQIQTVIITDSSRGESGLVRKVTAPEYLGAIVVCQGADSPSIRLAIVQAVSNAVGIGTDRISVLKMK